jgi:hypothetical protein
MSKTKFHTHMEPKPSLSTLKKQVEVPL